jgi:hypothetical protein
MDRSGAVAQWRSGAVAQCSCVVVRTLFVTACRQSLHLTAHDDIRRVLGQAPSPLPVQKQIAADRCFDAEVVRASAPILPAPIPNAEGDGAETDQRKQTERQQTKQHGGERQTDCHVLPVFCASSEPAKAHGGEGTVQRVTRSRYADGGVLRAVNCALCAVLRVVLAATRAVKQARAMQKSKL